MIYEIGFITVLYLSSKLIYFIGVLLRKKQDLLKTYGKSWVVITGASDGIGKEFAKQFSSMGFNIVLVARNETKLKAVQKEIKTETKIVRADFNKSFEKGFYDDLISQLKNLDISILVNCVGVDTFTKFHELPESEIIELITVDILPVTMMCHRLIAQMRKRNRSAIINVSSMAGVYPSIYFNVYSACKAYVEFLTKTLSSEYPEIDIMSLAPSKVSTNMTFNRKTDIVTILPSECVSGCLANLGLTYQTFGNWKHSLQGALYNYVPYPIYSYLLKKLFAPIWFREREIGLQQHEKSK